MPAAQPSRYSQPPAVFGGCSDLKPALKASCCSTVPRGAVKGLGEQMPAFSIGSIRNGRYKLGLVKVNTGVLNTS